MNTASFYTGLIEQLTTQLEEAYTENATLVTEISKLEGKLEVLNSFYDDFKYLLRKVSHDTGRDVQPMELPPEVLEVEPQPVPKSIQNYSELLSQYSLTNDSSLVVKLFEFPGVKTSQVLTDIRNQLPFNIVDLAKKYRCTKEYKIILKANKHINKLADDDFYGKEKSINDLIHNYILFCNRDKKSIAFKYLKQSLIYFPFQLDLFLKGTEAYRYDDFDENLEILKVELYGENNMLLTREKKTDGGKKFPRLDYRTISLDELVEVAKTHKNQKQKAERLLAQMRKVNRDEEDILLFVEEVNNFLKKSKIEIKNG